MIYDIPELRGNVTAGMYVGGQEAVSSHAMTVTRIITDRETMLSAPPDILLTNYKMLDYLLVRPKDSTLWIDNSPETLKYIAVDELHTFDGAHGTDLACLLRRLKAMLYVQPGSDSAAKQFEPVKRSGTGYIQEFSIFLAVIVFFIGVTYQNSIKLKPF